MTRKTTSSSGERSRQAAGKGRGTGRAPGGAPGQRQLRVGELLRHALSDILGRGNLQEPLLARTIVTISEIRMSPDMRHATIFVAPLGGGDPAELLRALTRVKSYLRGQLAREVSLRYMPDLHFEADTSFDYAARVDSVLHSPEVSRDLGPQNDPDPGDGDA